MPLSRRRRREAEEDTEINMVPIMNMFLVLIPFLLMSASFLHLKAINTSVPVQAERSADAAAEPEAKVTVVLELQARGLELSAFSDAVADEELERLAGSLRRGPDGAYPLGELAGRLRAIKERYPASDTLLLVPEGRVLYDTIIRTMDAARRTGEDPLFPNVVLSGKVG